MIIFTFPNYKFMLPEILNKIPGLKSGGFSINRFSNQEIYVSLNSEVANQDCLILGSISPPEQNLFSLLLLADTLKKQEALSTTVCLPYLSYGRADRDEYNKSLTIKWIGRLFKASSVDKLITFEAHSQLDQKLFPIPLISISTSEIFAKQIIKLSLEKYSLVSPDEGAIDLCQVTANLINSAQPIAYFKKKRDKKGIIHSTLIGKVRPQVIILDDILDTGATLLSCTSQLAKVGVNNIVIMVTHGLFTGSKWKKLWQNNVTEIYSTDTTQPRKDLDLKKIKILPMASFIAEKLKYYLNL